MKKDIICILNNSLISISSILAFVFSLLFFLFSSVKNSETQKRELYSNHLKNSNVYILNSIILDEEISIKQEKKEITDWKLLLVNDENTLNEDCAINTKTVRSNIQVDERIYEPLMKMIKDAKKEKLNLFVCSGYRSIKKQTDLFNNKMERVQKGDITYSEAFELAKKEVALPGTSEHMLGLSVDIVARDYMSLNNGFENTDEGKWLVKNCAKYGFILRYPKDKTEITGKMYESWHFRYVGEEIAAFIMENNLTLEEYIEYYYYN